MSISFLPSNCTFFGIMFPFFVEIFKLLFSIKNVPEVLFEFVFSVVASMIFNFLLLKFVYATGHLLYARIIFFIFSADKFQSIFPSSFLIFLQYVAFL